MLEIGTGCGYQTAVLAPFVQHVYSVERIAALLQRARSMLAELRITNVSLRHADGWHGWRSQAPFQGILVAAAPEIVPPELFEQLDEGGRLVIPIGARGQQMLLRVTRDGDGVRARGALARELRAVRRGHGNVNAHRESRGSSGASAAISALRVVLVLLALLASCTSTTSLPVSRRERARPCTSCSAARRLYKIAWQYRVDQQELANWNGIARSRPAARRSAAAARAAARLRRRGARAGGAPARFGSSADAATRDGAVAVDVDRAAGARLRHRRPRAPSVLAAPRPATRPPPAAALHRAGRGPRRGESSRASAPTTPSGRVSASAAARGSRCARRPREGSSTPAAGSSATGSSSSSSTTRRFSRAYGYNSELLVTQGQDVARGATIALMGQGPGRQPRLHFEIRRNGVPVDPLLFVTRAALGLGGISRRAREAPPETAAHWGSSRTSLCADGLGRSLSRAARNSCSFMG